MHSNTLQWKGEVMNKLTLEIDVKNTYIPLGKDFLWKLKNFNDIVENEKYFIVNGHRHKKLTLISMFTDPEDFYDVMQLESAKLLLKTTTGRLFLTKDPEWIKRCSDPDYCSWSSCFSPDGCHWLSANIYSRSTSVWMAMITNSEMTKIIGRAFVLIPIVNYDIRKFDNSAYMLKSYGTFPDNYKESVLKFIGKHFYNVDINEDDIKFPENDSYDYDNDDDTLTDENVAYHHNILTPYGVNEVWIDELWGYVDHYGKLSKGIKSIMFGDEIVYVYDCGRLEKSSYIDIGSMLQHCDDLRRFNAQLYNIGDVPMVYIVDTTQIKLLSTVNGDVNVSMAFDLIKKAISGDIDYDIVIGVEKIYNYGFGRNWFIEFDDKVIYPGYRNDLDNKIHINRLLGSMINEYIDNKKRRLNVK